MKLHWISREHGVSLVIAIVTVVLIVVSAHVLWRPPEEQVPTPSVIVELQATTEVTVPYE